MSTVSQPPPLPGFGLQFRLPPRKDGIKMEIPKARGEGRPLFQSELDHDLADWQKKKR